MCKTILIIEDEDVLRKVYADGLRDEDFFVIVAKNGKEGLETALREKPDLILLDILMPVMDGFAMMNALRNRSSYGKSVPIIILTNVSPNEEKIMREITKNEPTYYLVKSDWDLRQVVEKIRERLAVKA